jgi:hypothetical protein
MDPLVHRSLVPQNTSVGESHVESKQDDDDDDFELQAAFVDDHGSLVGSDGSSAMDVDPADGAPGLLALHSAMAILGSGPDRDRIFKIPMAYWQQVSTNASGILLTAASNLPSGSPSWSSAAAVFNQYRVKSMTVRLVPMYNVNFTGVVAQSMMSYIDEDDPSTPPTAYADALKHADTLSAHSGYEVVTRHYKQLAGSAAAPDTTWNDTAAPLATAAIKFVGNHSLISTVSHNLVIEWDVEFRGLGA